MKKLNLLFLVAGLLVSQGVVAEQSQADQQVRVEEETCTCEGKCMCKEIKRVMKLFIQAVAEYQLCMELHNDAKSEEAQRFLKVCAILDEKA